MRRAHQDLLEVPVAIHHVRDVPAGGACQDASNGKIEGALICRDASIDGAAPRVSPRGLNKSAFYEVATLHLPVAMCIQREEAAGFGFMVTGAFYGVP